MLVPYGKVSPTAGTPQRATTNLASPAETTPAHGVLIQVLPANIGSVYIGDATLNKVTMAGVIAVLPAPSSTFIPSFSAALAAAANAINVNDIWIDVDSTGDGVVVSALVD